VQQDILLGDARARQYSGMMKSASKSSDAFSKNTQGKEMNLKKV
jgi:hypothetical protein